MIRSLCALASAAALASTPGQSQTMPAPAPAAPATPITATILPGTAVLRTGTEVPLKLSEELTTKGKMLRVGQRFHMEVAEAVVVGGQTVIPVGAPAMGEITDVRNKGMWGKSGHLGARILYVTVNGRQIRMSGAFDDKGVTGTAGVVAAIAFVPVAGFFTTGTSAKIPVGAGVRGFIDEDVALSFATAPATPMVVTTVAPVAPVPTPAPAVVNGTAPAAKLTPVSNIKSK